jgi:hypothetical protein
MVDRITSPTNRCTQTLHGSGRALFCHRLGGVYVVDADEVDSEVQCDFGRFEVTVRLQTNRINRFSVCQSGGATGGVGGCAPVEVTQIFVGDCDDDSTVTVDEIVRMVGIALGINPLSSCPLGDADADEQVTVDEITTAATHALDGCRPASRYADLVPLSAREICRDGCGPYVIELCVANAGDVDADAFAVAINDRSAGSIEGLGANQNVCVEVPYQFPLDWDQPATATVDQGGAVREVDEDNNTLLFPLPNPTGCDVICAPTPEPGS